VFQEGLAAGDPLDVQRQIPGTDASNRPITRIDEDVGGPRVVNQLEKAVLELVGNKLALVSR